MKIECLFLPASNGMDHDMLILALSQSKQNIIIYVVFLLMIPANKYIIFLIVQSKSIPNFEIAFR
jgi:hypothetical protein